jgi:starch synthase
MRIAIVSSEVYPYSKTGGLADVAGSLPKALAALGHEVKVFTPNYDRINHAEHHINYEYWLGGWDVRVAGTNRSAHFHMTHLPGSEVKTYFVDCPHFFHRGKIYSDAPDEDERFIFFQKAVVEAFQHMNWKPDAIHCNDWQTGLIPLLVKDNYSWDAMFDDVATVTTIHNIGYQGRFPKETLYKAELRESLHYENGPIEVWGGDVCFLKAGLMFSDALNTVSPTYAKEIMTYEYGEGLDGVLWYRRNDFFGILNGVDYDIWSPDTDKKIPANYSASDLSGKRVCKRALQERFGLPEREDVPVVGIVSRMASQKGFDLVADALGALANFDAQWTILGSGEKRYEETFSNFAAARENVGAHIGYDDGLAHLIEAGADMFLMPSRYEPCGLNQIYSLRYGTAPIVRKTGGLADTVRDWDEARAEGELDGDGFSFHDYSSDALVSSVERAVNVYRQPELWAKLVQNAMKKNYSWERSAQRYVELYEHAIANRRGVAPGKPDDVSV